MRRVAFFAALLGASTALSAADAAAQHITAEPQSVASFLASKPAPGRYEVTAYVVGSFECPPCPEGAFCEPCPPDALYVADRPTPAPVTYDKLTEKALVLGTAAPASFHFGTRYRFLFELTGSKTSGRAINDCTLIEGKTS